MIKNILPLVDETIDLYAPMQVYEELVILTSLLSKRSFKNALEIGTHRCGLLNILTTFASGKVVSIDVCHPTATSSRQKFRELNTHVNLLEGDSHDTRMKETVSQLLNEEKLDILLIDGDHSVTGIWQDFHMYSSLVEWHGLIIFHDVDPQHAILKDPALVWKDLKQMSGYESAEIIYDGYSGGIDYSNNLKMLHITDMLFFHPEKYKLNYPDLNGLPCHTGGFGILRRM
jgi:predicted O-methyltransferase YrrM